jgi:hypothetical protein
MDAFRKLTASDTPKPGAFYARIKLMIHPVGIPT